MEPLPVCVRNFFGRTELKVEDTLTAHIYTMIPEDTSCCMLEKHTNGIHGEHLQVLLTSIQQYYPHIDHMRVNDMCGRLYHDDENFTQFLLPYLTTGRFWYQLQFGAYREAENEALFQEKERAFQETKSLVSWSGFDSCVITALPLPESEMREMYDAAPTWQAFFASLCAKMGNEAFCEFLAPWIRPFLLLNCRHLMCTCEFLIPIGGIYG